jgi:hypothetical protein
VTITLVDDTISEDPEPVILTLSASPDYVVIVPRIASLTILDDDGAVVTIAATDPAASGAGPDTGTFTLTRTGGDLSSSLLVLVARSGTANDGSDYASLGGFTFAVTIPANETSVTITVTPFPDAAVEGDETVILTISPRAVYVIGTPGAATVTISDSSQVFSWTSADT